MENVNDNIIFFKASKYSKLFWNEWLLRPENVGYNVCFIYDIYGELDTRALLESLKLYVANNSLLRSFFQENKDGELYHYIKDTIFDAGIIFKDFSHSEEKIISFIDYTINITFDLRKPPLFNFALIKKSAKEYTLVLKLHHIIIDGNHAPTFLNGISSHYNNYNKNEKIEKDSYLGDMKKYLKFELNRDICAEKESIKYWVDLFKNTNFANNLPNLKFNKIESYKPDYFYFSFDNEYTSKIRSFCSENKISLFNLMSAAWSFILSHYTGQDELVLIYPVNIRPKEFSELSGCMVNTVLLKVNLSEDETFVALLTKLKNQRKSSKIYQTTLLLDILQALRENEKVDLNNNNFFNIAIAETDLRLNSLNLNDLTVIPHTTQNLAGSELAFEYWSSSDLIKCQINFKSDLFDKSLIELMSEHFKKALYLCIEYPEKKLSSFLFLNNSEYQQIVYDWNKTEAPYPKDKTIHQLFEETVEKYPDNTAVVFDDNSLTYRELSEKANQLAHFIRHAYKGQYSEELKGDTLFGIYIERSLEMIISILAILKAGGAYVPFDSADPQERLKFKIKDCGCKMVLTSSTSVEDLLFLTETDTLPVSVDTLKDELINYSIDNPANINKSTDLAYVIYTSGSTGQPKGVMIEHKSAVNLICEQKKAFQMDEKKSSLQFASISFDAAFSEIFVTIVSGSKLYIANNIIKNDLSLFSYYLKNNLIQIATIPPVLFEQLNFSEFSKVETIVVAGDVTSFESMNNFSSLDKRLLNAYGPTESTVCASYHQYAKNDSNKNIGKPLKNITLYILDNYFLPLPIGVTGELYIGGDGLARGYLNNAELSKERFIDNPFVSEEDKLKGRNLRLYKTGDLCRYLPDGNIEFIGRNDDQIKIRGFRVELGDIESKLSSYEGVKQSAVLCREKNNNKYLIAYYVPNASHESRSTSHDLREYLSNLLPDYMVPSVFVELESLPLNTSGKIDRKALPDPEFKTDGDNYLLPQNSLERTILDIWRKILNANNVGINDNFFHLGGNSILAMKLKESLEKQVKDSVVKITDVFKYPTVKKYSEFMLSENNKLVQMYNTKPSDFNKMTNSYIAVIAYSGAFSGTEELGEYFDLIFKGKEGIEFLSVDECVKLGIDEEILSNSDFVKARGYVKNTDMFDSFFWNISPNEASLMDPQIRKFLEHSWNVLEKSGYLNKRSSFPIGVFAGTGNSTYLNENIIPSSNFNKDINLWEASTLNGNNFVSTRTSYLLNLNGPSININTACSTSLSAIIEASKNLKDYSCDMALAGGVSLAMPENIGYIYQEGMILSKDGHCRTFDAESSGTVFGSGVGVVLLKRLSDAERDRDKILAVIKGYALNNDGDDKVGYSAPSVKGQSQCILKAQQFAGITSDTIDYVECHGTGTKLGDPIEIAALNDVFRKNKKKVEKASCIIGSVKANIGHSDAAAGVAGFIKVCRMLETKIIPPQINFKNINSELNIVETPFKIGTETEEWTNKNHPRRAGVSSFGIGGTNAHIILEEYENSKINNTERKVVQDTHIFPLSAKSESSLKAYTQKLIEYITSNPKEELVDIAFTLQNNKHHFNVRQSVSASTFEELLEKLKSLGTPIKLSKSELDNSSDIIFMFSGQGSQYVNMCREMYETEIVFKENIDRCFSFISKYIGFDFRAILFPYEDVYENEEILKQTKYAQIALFAVSYSLSKYYESIGINAVSFIGHSIGEYTAATLSGVFSLEDVVKIVIERGRLMQSMPVGKMLSVNLSVNSLISMLPKDLEISVVNTQDLCVVSGNEQSVIQFKNKLNYDNISSTLLHTSHAFHSKMMDGVIDEFQKFLKSIKMNKPLIPFISNVTGEFITNDEAISPLYWGAQLRSCVQFSKGINTLTKKYLNPIFIELGPGSILSNFVKNHKCIRTNSRFRTTFTIPSFKEKNINSSSKYNSICRIWNLGVNIEWKAIHKNDFNELKHVYDLPTYQFDKIKCWIKKESFKNLLRGQIYKEIKEELLINNVHIPESIEKKYEKIIISSEELIIASNEDNFNNKSFLIESNSTKMELSIACVICKILGLEKISKNDNFFELGGNSISAIKAASEISKLLNGEFKISDLLKFPTVKLILENNYDESILIPKCNKDEAILSFAQERLFFIEQYEGGSNAYNMPMFFEVTEKVTKEILEKSINAIALRHEVLKSIFIESCGEYFQQVKNETVKIECKILNSDEELKTILNKDVNYLFNLKKEYPLKVAYYQSELKNYLLILIHHIAFDGWSVDVFVNELNVLLNHYIFNKPLLLSDLDIQYRDFAVWQRSYLTGGKLTKEISYWKKKLSGYENLNFPVDKIRPSFVKYEGAEHIFRIDTVTSLKLRKMASENQITLYTLLLGAFYVLLYKYTSQKDITIGTPTANRHYKQLESIIGFFVNSLPLRTTINEELNFQEFLSQIKILINEAQENQDIPFEKIVEQLNVQKDLSRHPIFQIMFGVQSFDVRVESSVIKKSNICLEYTPAKFDLTCFIDDSTSELSCNFNYSISIFDKSTIKRFAEHFTNILKTITENDYIIRDINILSPREYQQIVYDWNDTEATYPKDKTIHQLFEEMVEKYPNNTAVVFEESSLTYRELNERCNQLANFICHTYKEQLNEELKGDTLIGIYIERSLEMIISILAILKAGGAYVPFDSADPQERLKFKIKDCGCKMILTSSTSVEDLLFLTETDTLPVSVDTLKDELSLFPKSTPQHINKSTDLAYVIYTSGSTGQPKGVMIEHRSVIRLVINQKYIDFKGKSFAFAANLAFDASTFELWGALMNGLTLHVITKEVILDKNKAHDYYSRYIDVAWFTSGLFSSLVDVNPLIFKNLKYLLAGGDVLLKDKVLSVANDNLSLQIINGYGPTESTTFATTYTYGTLLDNELETIPIGKPINNTSCYILNKSLLPVPVGAIGELYIGGDGLARGYLNRPDLTKERFIDNPFASNEDKLNRSNLRLYKTGDLCRYLPDGNIEFIGRNDDQVKIRGFRVELGEIETKLNSYEGIKQSVVLCKEKNNNKYLAAYYVINANHEPRTTNHDLREYLSNILPDYMVPSVFVELESFPLNTSGKIDRKSLPDPEFKGDEDNYAPPRNEIEEKLCQIWQELLGIEKVGINDDFFEAGGNSILAIKTSSAVSSLGLDLHVRDIFTYKSIASILSSKNVIKEEIIYNIETIKSFPLSYMEMHYFKYADYDNHIFNVVIRKKYNYLDLKEYRHAIFDVIDKIDSFKIKYKYSPHLKSWVHSCQKENICNIVQEQKRITVFELKNNIEKLVYEISIQNGYSVIFYIVNFDNVYNVFLISHHLYVDTISMEFIMNSIDNKYETNINLLQPSIIEWLIAKQQFDLQPYMTQIHHIFDIKNTISNAFECSNLEIDFYNDYECLEKNIIMPFLADTVTNILAQLFVTISQKFDQKIVIIDHVSNGRDADLKFCPSSLTSLCGWLAINYPIQVDTTKNILEQVKNNTKTEIGVLYSIAKERNIERLVEKSPFLFNAFIVNQNYDNSRFDIIDKEIKLMWYERSDYKIIFKALISSSALKLICTYNLKSYSRKFVSELLNSWCDNVVKIIVK